MPNGLLDLQMTKVGLLGEVVDKLEYDPRDVTNATKVAPLLNQLLTSFRTEDHSDVMPKHELMIELIEALKDLIECKYDHNSLALPESVRLKLANLMARIVQDLTDADCVLVRRLLADGTVELVGESLFRDGTSEDELRPPKLKKLHDGIRSHILYFYPGHRITVVSDVASPETDSDFKETLRLNLALWDPESPEHRFISSIRSEVCIPLVSSGKMFAGVVAVRWRPYQPSQAERIRLALEEWQKILNYFYNYLLTIEKHDELRLCMDAVSQSIPQVAASVTDAEFLRKTVTLLTCGAGLGWHRSFVYLFRDTFPSDATCVMAVGGLGGPEWPRHQCEMASKYKTLAQYLLNAEDPSYGIDDPLYVLAQANDRRLTISGSHISAHKDLCRIFSGGPEPELGFRRGDETLYLRAGDAWLSEGSFASATLTGAAATCDHVLIPLIRQRPFEPLGFVILDNPYDHSNRFSADPSLTRLVCHLLSSFLVERDLGTEGWWERYNLRNEAIKAARQTVKNYKKALEKSYIQSARAHLSELAT